MARAGLLARPEAVRIADHFRDFRWRLANLYWITTKDGKRLKFEPNWAQQRFLDSMHSMNVILKARQLGMTTFIQVFMLDQVVFNSNVKAGTIAHTLGDAMSIFEEKVKYPYDSLPEGIRAARGRIRDSRTELALNNNSSIRVGTSMRSGTLNYLHVSEYGKLCAKFPEKAREVRTGALNTVQAGQWVAVESTAEGQEGGFFEMCEKARAAQRCGSRLTELDFKFHFFPWWKEPAYRIDPDGVVIGADFERYFDELEARHGIATDGAQRAWYAKKAGDQLGDMKREFPSTADEAFEASVEGAYYGAWIEAAETQGRVGEFKSDPAYPVHTVWDIGVGDATAIWFFQILPGEVRVVGYFEASGEGLPFYAALAKRWYESHGWSREGAHDFVPHDARVREWGTKKTRLEQMTEAGFNPRIPAAMGIDDGINAVRALLPICTFDAAGTAEGVKVLKAYRKEWNEEAACWRDAPLHNWASHGADAFRYLASGHRDVRPVKVAPKKAPPGALTFEQLMAREQELASRARHTR
jgi:hypothetical protein